MFKIGDYIVYGTTGVCKVCDITPMCMDDSGKDRDYYILEPVTANSGRIYTPTDSKKNIMRRVLSREEALELIDHIPTLPELAIPEERQREYRYKEALMTCDCHQWISMIKTLYLRKRSRQAAGKRLTEVDERYYRKARENLYQELSIPLEMPSSMVEDYICERIGLKTESGL